MNCTVAGDRATTLARAATVGVLAVGVVLPGVLLWIFLVAAISGFDHLFRPYEGFALAAFTAAPLVVPTTWLVDRWFGRRRAALWGVVLFAAYVAVFRFVVSPLFVF